MNEKYSKMILILMIVVLISHFGLLIGILLRGLIYG